MTPPKRIILASSSPRRIQLIRAFNIPIVVCPPNVDELKSSPQGPIHLVLSNAQLKANAVLKSYPDDLVIAADTLVTLENEVLNKPQDIDDARTMLKKLSNKTHSVLTGFSILFPANNLFINDYESTQVTFKPLNDAIIDEYFQHVNPLDKSGSYAIQEKTDLIIAHYEGSLSNVTGLPIESISNYLKPLGLSLEQENVRK